MDDHGRDKIDSRVKMRTTDLQARFDAMAQEFFTEERLRIVLQVQKSEQLEAAIGNGPHQSHGKDFKRYPRFATIAGSSSEDGEFQQQAVKNENLFERVGVQVVSQLLEGDDATMLMFTEQLPNGQVVWGDLDHGRIHVDMVKFEGTSEAAVTAAEEHPLTKTLKFFPSGHGLLPRIIEELWKRSFRVDLLQDGKYWVQVKSIEHAFLIMKDNLIKQMVHQSPCLLHAIRTYENGDMTKTPNFSVIAETEFPKTEANLDRIEKILASLSLEKNNRKHETSGSLSFSSSSSWLLHVERSLAEHALFLDGAQVILPNQDWISRGIRLVRFSIAQNLGREPARKFATHLFQEPIEHMEQLAVDQCKLIVRVRKSFTPEYECLLDDARKEDFLLHQAKYQERMINLLSSMFVANCINVGMDHVCANLRNQALQNIWTRINQKHKEDQQELHNQLQQLEHTCKALRMQRDGAIERLKTTTYALEQEKRNFLEASRVSKEHQKLCQALRRDLDASKGGQHQPNTDSEIKKQSLRDEDVATSWGNETIYWKKRAMESERRMQESSFISLKQPFSIPSHMTNFTVSTLSAATTSLQNNQQHEVKKSNETSSATSIHAVGLEEEMKDGEGKYDDSSSSSSAISVIKSHDGTNQDLRIEISRLSKELDSRNSELKSVVEHKRECEKQLTGALKALQEADSCKEKYSTDIAALKSSVGILMKKLEEAKAANTKTVSNDEGMPEIEEEKPSYQIARVQIEMLTRYLDRLRQEFAQTKTLKRNGDKEIAELRESLGKKDHLIIQLRRGLKSQQEACDNFRLQMEREQHRAQTMEGAIQNRDEQLSYKDKVISENQTVLESAKQCIKDQMERIRSLEGICTDDYDGRYQKNYVKSPTSKDVYHFMQEQLHQQEQTIQKMKEEMSSMNDIHRRKMILLEASRSAIEKAANKDRVNLSSKVIDLGHRLHIAVEDLDQVTAQRNKAQNDLLAKQKQDNMELLHVCQELHALQAKVCTVKDEEEAQHVKRIDELSEDLKKTREKLQLVQLHKEKEQVTNHTKIKLLTTELQEIKQSNTTLKTKLEETQKHLDTAQEHVVLNQRLLKKYSAVDCTTPNIISDLFKHVEITEHLAPQKQARVGRILQDLRITVQCLEPYLKWTNINNNHNNNHHHMNHTKSMML